MNKEEIRALVAQMLGDLSKGTSPISANTPHPEPPVKAGDYRPTDPKRGEGDLPEDLSQTDLRKVYNVENPKNPKAFLVLREKTPARLGVGRAGPRYSTKSTSRLSLILTASV